MGETKGQRARNNNIHPTLAWDGGGEGRMKGKDRKKQKTDRALKPRAKKPSKQSNRKSLSEWPWACPNMRLESRLIAWGLSREKAEIKWTTYPKIHVGEVSALTLSETERCPP